MRAIKYFVIFLSIILLTINTAAPYRHFANGQETKRETGNITVFPTFYEIHASPGEKKEFVGTIQNNTDKTIDVEILFKNLSVETVIKRDILALVESTDPRYPSSWLSTQKNAFKVPAQSSYDAFFALEIPNKTELQGYYPVIIYRIKAQQKTPPLIGETEEIASIIYLDVRQSSTNPNISYGNIVKFEVKDKFVITPHAEFTLIFENNGKSFIHPRGKIHIYDNTGKRLSNTPTVNDRFVYLVQGERLEEKLIWEPKYTFTLIPQFGKYKAVVEILHNPQQPFISTAETFFYVVPLWHIIGAVIFIAAFVTTIVLLIKTIKGQLRRKMKRLKK